jgi:hypothetical protein
VIIPREGKESNNNEMMNREEMNRIESWKRWLTWKNNQKQKKENHAYCNWCSKVFHKKGGCLNCEPFKNYILKIIDKHFDKIIC